MNCKFCNSENLSALIGGNWLDSAQVTSSKRSKEPIDKVGNYEWKEFNVRLCSDCGRITEFPKRD